MRRLALFICLLPYLVSAKDVVKPSKAPENKYAISLLTGRALDMNDFVLEGAPGTGIYHNNLTFYRNFKRLQVGIGVDVAVMKVKNINKYFRNFITPYLLLNRTLETNDFCFYAGVMAGYSRYSYSNNSTNDYFKTTGNGIVGGVQMGIVFKINKFLAINSEIAARARETRYKYVHKQTANFAGYPPGTTLTTTNTYGISDFYMPIQIGVRVRF